METKMKLVKNGILFYLVFNYDFEAEKYLLEHKLREEGCLIVCFNGYGNAISFPEKEWK